MSSKDYPDIEDHLETFLLYWLDAEVNKSDDNKRAQKQLRSIIKHLQTFDDQDQCQQTIKSLDEQNRLILIVSGRIGRELVPQIHQLRQLSSIYIYCQDKSLHEEWARDFFKVREVIVDLNQLIIEIKFGQRSRLKIELPISYNIYTMIEDQKTSTTSLNKNFTQSFMLINTLIRLESSTEEDKQEFLSLCKKEYKSKKNQLNLIDEFRDMYKPEKVLWWYTRDSFFHRTLDKVLRATAEYFEQLLLSRSFITDIYEQLKQNQYQSSIRVYFGQLMWLSEIEYLRDDKSRYLSTNTFWLTNINRNKVVDLLNNAKKGDNEHEVLFIIDADPNLDTNQPFADISKFCHFDEKGEILFMIGSVFRIIEVTQEGQMYVVRMELCGNHEQFNESMEIIDGNERINFRTFGDLLYRMEQYDLAERIYRHLLAKLLPNDPSCSDLYFALGAVSKCKKEYDSSLKFYKKSLENKLQTDRSDYITIGKLHACIGEIYRLKDNDKEALKSFEKAIDIYTKEHDEYHHHMADFYDNAALICRRLKKNNDALEYYKKALTVDEKQPSSNSLGVAKSHNNIGIIYCLLDQYDLALAHYRQSLTIKLDIHPSPELSIANSYVNMAGVYKTMNDLEKALDYYQKAANIYENLLPNQDPDRIQINNEIQIISQRRK